MESPDLPDAKRIRLEGEAAGSKCDSTGAADGKSPAAVDGKSPAAVEGKADDKLDRVRRQVEYYLSDENLIYDKFFNEKINSSEGGWLPLENILTCKRIEQLGATKEDILAAVKDSPNIESKEDAVRRVKPCPQLQPRKNKRGEKGGDGERKISPELMRLGRGVDFNSAGLILKIQGLPEEASWETLRKNLMEFLPPDVEHQKSDGSSFYDRTIKFVSQADSERTCYCLLRPFPDDRRTVQQLSEAPADAEAKSNGDDETKAESETTKDDASGETSTASTSPLRKKSGPLIINGVPITVTIVSDANEAFRFIDTLPQGMKKRWQSEIQRNKQAVNAKPIKIGDQEFESVDYLKRCLKEALQTFQIGKPINKKTTAVLKDLVENYHPRGPEKMKDFAEFKVDLATFQTKDGKEDSTRCFFIVKADGSSEDFSLQKCFGPLSNKPPFIQSDAKPNAS